MALLAQPWVAHMFRNLSFTGEGKGVLTERFVETPSATYRNLQQWSPLVTTTPWYHMTLWPFRSPQNWPLTSSTTESRQVQLPEAPPGKMCQAFTLHETQLTEPTVRPFRLHVHPRPPSSHSSRAMARSSLAFSRCSTTRSKALAWPFSCIKPRQNSFAASKRRG